MRPTRGPATPSSVLALIVVAIASAAAFWAWIGWDTQRISGPDGGLQGPLEPWQVKGFLVSVLVIGVLNGLLGHGLELVAGMTGTLTVSATIWVRLYAGPGLGGQGGVGVMLILVGTALATGTVATLTDRRLRRSALATLRPRPSSDEFSAGPAGTGRNVSRPWVWTAPPIWPTPPSGWSPPPGWRPDPAWPPVPPRHVFWRHDQREQPPQVAFWLAVTAVLCFGGLLIFGLLDWFLLDLPDPFGGG